MRKKQSKNTIGPIQLLAIEFEPHAEFKGKILNQLEQLDRMKTIRILDLLFVKKDAKTKDLVALRMQEEKLGAIVGALMGFGFENSQANEKKKETNSDNNAFGLSIKQIEQIGESLKPGSSAGILLIEHVWARDLKQAIREAGGIPIAEGFLTPEAIAEVANEIMTMAAIMNQMEEDDTL